MTKHNHSIHSLAYRRFQANENNVDLIKLTREDLSQVSVSNEFAIMKVKRETGCLGFGKIGRGQSTCLHPLCSECVVFLLFSPYVHVCVLCFYLNVIGEFVVCFASFCWWRWLLFSTVETLLKKRKAAVRWKLSTSKKITKLTCMKLNRMWLKEDFHLTAELYFYWLIRVTLWFISSK